MHKDIQQQQHNTKCMWAFPANAELNNVNLTRNNFVIQNDWNGNAGKNTGHY